MVRMHLFTALLLALTLGCAAARSTYHLAQAEQQVLLAETSEAPTMAEYEWTLTQQYILKAREEWANAAFGDAEDLAKLANEWATRADQAAQRGQTRRDSQNMGEFVPEEVDIDVEDEDPLMSPDEPFDFFDDGEDE